MMKKLMLRGFVLAIAVIVVSHGLLGGWAAAQETRSIVQYPRGDVAVEAVHPVTKVPMRSFCIGPNAIDVKLTNNSNYRKYVSVVNRDTRGMEQVLYRGWLEVGTQYLSALMRMQLELTGPAGMEMLRVDINEYGQVVRKLGFILCSGLRVRDNGRRSPKWPPQVHLWAILMRLSKVKGTICKPASGHIRDVFEILNSWGNSWLYQISLPNQVC